MKKMKGKLIKRNICALILTALILMIPLLFKYREAMAESGNEKKTYLQEIEYHLYEKSSEEIRHGEMVRWRNYYKEHKMTKYERVAEGETFKPLLPNGYFGGGGIKYYTERIYLNGVKCDTISNFSYIVTDTNKVVIHAYNDYVERWVKYVERIYDKRGEYYYDKELACDRFRIKQPEDNITVYHVNMNRVPGYKVSFLEYVRKKRKVEENPRVYWEGSITLLVVMEPIEVKDDEPPEITVKDIYAPLFALRDGTINTAYVINEISVKDNKDGTLNKAARVGETGVYIENLTDEDLKNVAGDTVIEIVIVARDTAGNISKKSLKLYAVDTTPVNTTEGRVKKIRFFE